MARQKGPVLLEGTVGGIIFDKSKYGYLVRSRGGISRQRIATEARFARTRENASEFGYASRAGKLLRLGVKAGCPGAEDGNTNARLAGRLMKIVQADAVNGRGQRQLTSETVQQLEGFEWKESATLGLLLPVDIDLSRGVAICRMPGLTAKRRSAIAHGRHACCADAGGGAVGCGGKCSGKQPC